MRKIIAIILTIFILMPLLVYAKIVLFVLRMLSVLLVVIPSALACNLVNRIAGEEDKLELWGEIKCTMTNKLD